MVYNTISNILIPLFWIGNYIVSIFLLLINRLEHNKKKLLIYNEQNDEFEEIILEGESLVLYYVFNDEFNYDYDYIKNKFKWYSYNLDKKNTFNLSGNSKIRFTKNELFNTIIYKII